MGFRMKTVARETGLSPLLIRAWERRYRLVEPKRAENGFREYSALDLRTLRAARALVDSGRPISEVAALERPTLLEEGEAILEQRQSVGPSPADTEREAFLAAVSASDPARAQQAISRAFALFPPDQALRDLLEPALRKVGELWEQGAITPAQEHMASDLIRHRVRALVEAATPAPGAGRGTALLACAPGERHDIALLFVALRLARSGFSPVALGADLPLADLSVMARSRGPAIVGISITVDEAYRKAARGLAKLRGRVPRETRLLVGGQATVRFEEQLQEWGFEVNPAEALAVV